MKAIVLIFLMFSLFCCRSKTGSNSANKPNIHLSDTSKYTSANDSTLDQPTCNELYNSALLELKEMLESEQNMEFKRAVFIVEDAFFAGKLDYKDYCKEVTDIIGVCNKLIGLRKIDYNYEDSVGVKKNAAIFSFFRDTTFFIIGKEYKLHLPVQYDFEDYNGVNDWTKMFVSKLMVSNSGNCHSLPFLYKILADEMDTEAYLALAPNHIYIKHRSKKTGWYNTELTSGQFPLDSWIMASGYITIDAIRNGIYMDTLSARQAISLCLIDLAKGYERKTGNVSDGFIIQCCDLALSYFPTYVNALLLKAETLKKQFYILMKEHKTKQPSDLFNDPLASNIYAEMQKNYVKALQLGYREMPEKMYKDWLASIKEEKYRNKNISK